MSEALEAVELFGAAFAGSLLVALACALLGVHVAARRLVVVGVALPQAAALGIAVSFAFSGGHGPLASHDLMALVCVLGAVALLAWAGRRRALDQGTLAGVVFAGAGALTILLMMRTAQGLDEVRNLVEGHLLALHGPELTRLSLILGPVVVLQLLGARRLVFVTFDRETAAALGLRTGLWEVLFHLSLALVVAAGVHATGTLFVFGFLVIPGLAGLALGRSSAGVIGTSVAVGVAGAALGFVLSYLWDTPTGPTCTATALALLLVCAVVGELR